MRVADWLAVLLFPKYLAPAEEDVMAMGKQQFQLPDQVPAKR
jgi:hypothetical protein